MQISPVDRARLTDARATVSGAIRDLTTVSERVRHEEQWGDITNDRWTGYMRQELGMARGRLEGVRGVVAIEGVDTTLLFGAMQQIDEGLSKMDDLAGQTRRWRPLYDMVASDARRATELLGAFTANIDALTAR